MNEKNGRRSSEGESEEQMKTDDKKLHGEPTHVASRTKEPEAETDLIVAVRPRFFLDLTPWGGGVVEIAPTPRLMARAEAYLRGGMKALESPPEDPAPNEPPHIPDSREKRRK